MGTHFSPEVGVDRKLIDTNWNCEAGIIGQRNHAILPLIWNPHHRPDIGEYQLKRNWIDHNQI